MSAHPDYVVLSQSHVNQWSPALQQAVPGWEIKVQDAVTGTIVPVFIDDGHYTVEGAQALIEAALAPVREIAALGSTQAASAAS